MRVLADVKTVSDLKPFCSAYPHITKVNMKTHDINAI
jgi:hypothetical protein